MWDSETKQFVSKTMKKGKKKKSSSGFWSAIKWFYAIETYIFPHELPSTDMKTQLKMTELQTLPNMLLHDSSP